jgi:Isochorismatase family
MTREAIDGRLLDLVPSLARFAPPATVIDKHVYSPFVERGLLQFLRGRYAEALVVTGAETDVCVLAAVLGAVDFGYRVVLATDGLCSASDTTHDALLTLTGSAFPSKSKLQTWPPSSQIGGSKRPPPRLPRTPRRLKTDLGSPQSRGTFQTQSAPCHVSQADTPGNPNVSTAAARSPDRSQLATT